MRAGGIGEGRGGLCKRSDTHTHLHSDYKLHKNISGGSVCACVYRGERTGEKKKTYSKQNGGGKQSFPPSLCEKSAL